MNKNRGVIPETSLERIRLIMKKTLSIVLALVMVFAFAFPTFATTDDESTTVVEATKPTDPAELGAYYAELLNAEGSDPAAVVTEMLGDLDTGDGQGLYTVDDLPVVLEAFAANSEDATKLAEAFVQIEKGLADMGIVIPEVTLPDETLPDVTLPDDEESESDDSDFLNTILGILGSIGDMIFGSGSGDSGDAGDGSVEGDDAWDDTFGDESGSEDDDLIPDTGDTAVISVAAVALVAGAALVLTRKKSDDAE